MDAEQRPGPPRWIDDEAGLTKLVEELSALPRFAIDTESNSMHAYTEQICLVQVSGPDFDAIVDPLAVDLAPLGRVLQDPAVQKVMHGADYDVMCFKRGPGIAIENLYDTMLAERVLGRARYGLGALLSEHFGFAANKKMQRFDWGRRPLPQHAIDYARYDTHFLLRLQALQLQALKDADRLEDHAHACLRQAQVEPKDRPFDDTAFWKIKGIKGVADPGAAVLHRLFVLRDEVAAAVDRPHFRVISDATLLQLARAQPRDHSALMAELERARGVHPRVRRQYADRMLEAIEAGIAAGKAPRRKRPPEETRAVTERFDALRAWRKKMATAGGIEPDMIIGKQQLLAIARADPPDLQALTDGDLLDAFELSRYGASIAEWLDGQKRR